MRSKYIEAEEADYNYASYQRAKAHKEFLDSANKNKADVAWVEYSTWDETMKYMKKWIGYQGYEVVLDGTVANNDIAYNVYKLRKVLKFFP